MAKLIIGCGYLGRRVADLWLRGGESVYAMTRSKQRADSFREAGIQPIVADVTDSASLESLGRLTEIDTVVFAVGFDRGAGNSIEEVYVDGLKAVVESLPADIGRLIYVSSTGVYGQSSGEWVDEDSPCEPTRDGGKACLKAEAFLQSGRFGNRTIILRLAGIYGPDRVPRKADLIANKSFPTTGHLNLIHVADAASTVLAAEKRAGLPSLYVVSDGAPVLRSDYYDELRRLLNIDISTTQTKNSSDGSAASSAIETSSRQARARADKRIRSDRFRLDLQVEMQFPNYREGLRAIIESDGAG